MDFEPGQKDLTEFDPDYCIIHLDQDIAPGGYGWVFPKSETKVNIGLGVEKAFLDKRNKRLGKKDNVESLMKEYLERNTAITNAKLSEDPTDTLGNNHSGIFQVSVRRQNECMVSGGYMMVGDAAGQAKPTTAGGIFTSGMGGVYAGQAISKFLKTNNRSELLEYQKKWIDRFGKEFEKQIFARKMLERIDNQTINKLFKSITPEITKDISEKDDFDFHTSSIIKLLGMKGSIKTAQTLIGGELKKLWR